MDGRSGQGLQSAVEAEDKYMDSSASPELVTITATIVAAYVSNNTIASTELPSLIAETHAALSRA